VALVSTGTFGSDAEDGSDEDNDAGRGADGAYLALSASDDEDGEVRAAGGGGRGSGRGHGAFGDLDGSDLRALESKYLSATLLAKIESGQDVIINGRRLT
jgi:hypothetical protein